MSTRRAADFPREQYSLFDSTMPLRQESQAGNLPASARELVEVIGLDATIDLVKDFGGDELKIPEAVNGVSRMWEVLVETVGPEAAEKLVIRFGRNPIYVPKCHLQLIGLRDREIVRQYDEGMKISALVRKYSLTRRHIFRVLKKPV